MPIKPVQNDFDTPRGYGDWAPQIHPDGTLYFFDSKDRIYTDGDLSLQRERENISRCADQLLQQAQQIVRFPCKTSELVLEKTAKDRYGYYFVEPEKCRIFWLTEVLSERITRRLERVQSPTHIKYAMEAEYCFDLLLLLMQPRTHCLYFPNNLSITADILDELEQMILHAVADNITLTTSVIPFDQEELAKMLDLMDRLKYAIKKPFPHAKCIVAQFMENFAWAKFINFCGQPGARLNSDQSIFCKQKPQCSMFIQFLSLCLFWAPCNYAKELDGIWVDRVINRVLWKQFIARLNDDWSNLALTATMNIQLYLNGDQHWGGNPQTRTGLPEPEKGSEFG
ncbi:hypothetical protein DFH29DRAFT_995774 [Suillus ampliporus]|nr:hypothetical protein DFH29DRAFT_995774 [Suillus ampliporus]